MTPPPMAPAYPSMGGYPPQPPPQRSASRVWKIVVIAVVLVVIIGVLAFVLFPSAPAIQVGQINVWSSDNVCGLNDASTYGFNASTGDVVPLSFDITGAPYGTGNATYGCTIMSVTTNSSGFSVSDVNVPLAVPANATEVLNFNVQCPNSTFSGDLNLVMA
jgi:hypothetical protein